MGFFDDLFHSNHSKYTEYSNSHLERKYYALCDKAIAKGNEHTALQNQIKSNYENAKRHYEENINRFKNEKNYSALNSASPENLVEAVKADMRRELEDEIARDKQELEQIDKMIAKIEELASR